MTYILFEQQTAEENWHEKRSLRLYLMVVPRLAYALMDDIAFQKIQYIAPRNIDVSYIAG